MPVLKRAEFDPGLTQRYTGRLHRAIEKDGSFNVQRNGVGLRDKGFYLHLMSASWPWFLLQVGVVYTLANVLFAAVYYWIGVEWLMGAPHATKLEAFLSAFFFSVQTFTTVGYGHIAPTGILTSSVAALEAMIGLLAFALGTGLLYGRFSRPSARLVFSRQMVVAPFNDGQAVMFRVANGRPNVLMELEATVILMTVEDGPEGLKRHFKSIALERDKVFFLPLTWTVVHPIDETSPLHGLDADDLRRLQAEFLILIKAFDDTFSQAVHARYSYTFEEVEWASRFLPAFNFNSEGEMVLNLEQLDRSAKV